VISLVQDGRSCLQFARSVDASGKRWFLFAVERFVQDGLAFASSEKTDNSERDEDNRSIYTMRQDIITELMDDSTSAGVEFTKSCYMKLQARQRKVQTASGSLADQELFTKGSTLGTIEEAWLIVFLASNSDMTGAEIIETKAQDNKNPVHLLCVGTGIQQGWKLPDEMKVRAIYARVMGELLQTRAQPLQHWKRDGGLVAKKINWKGGVYEPKYDDESNKLKTIRHRYTNITIDVQKSVIDKQWGLDQNWCDAAVFELEDSSMPSIQVKDLWKAATSGDKTGPFSKDKLTYEKLKALGIKHHVAWKAAASALQEGGSSMVADTRKALADASAGKRAGQMKRAHEQAKVAGTEKKKARILKYGE
jgi:hypothetical protein